MTGARVSASSAPATIIRAPEWAQIVSTSRGARRVLTATSTAPASGTAKWATSRVGVFRHRYATRSPGAIPEACSARATRVTSAPSSR